MYNTPFDRIKCIIDGYFTTTECHVHELFLFVNEDLHLSDSKKAIQAKGELNFLFNLTADPVKAYKILEVAKSIFQKRSSRGLHKKKKKEFYFAMLLDTVRMYFKNDSVAEIYVAQLIESISKIVDDDTQFSELDYF